MNHDKCVIYQPAALRRDGGPSNIHFQQGSIRFWWAQRYYHTCTGAEFSRGTSFWVYHEALHPYVKSGMRPTRGSNAGN